MVKNIKILDDDLNLNVEFTEEEFKHLKEIKELGFINFEEIKD